MNTIIEYLETHCDELSPKSFYRLIFPEGELDEKRAFSKNKYTGTAVGLIYNQDKREKSIQKVERYSITDSLEEFDNILETDAFWLMSPISYAGSSRKSEYARFMYALAIDVDNIKLTLNERLNEPLGMADLFYQFDGNGPSNYLPKPTAIVASGTGLHIYYVFEKPIPLFKNIVEQLEVLKQRLTWQLWTQGVTTTPDNIQYESLFQGFRIVGTKTKVGTKARAFLVDEGRKVSVEYLNKFVPEQYRTKDFTYKSQITLSEAKKKYPEWYQKRIVNGKERGTWQASKDVYNWWIRKIKESASEGHRYWCVMALATYAKKCGVDSETLEKDAISLIPFLDAMTTIETNHFNEADVLDALEAYNDSYITYPIDAISYRTDIPIEKNKRNGRKQKKHLERARAVQAIDYPDGEWRKGNGRPKGSGTAANKVRTWREEHPDGTKAQCKSETGLTYPTIRKWWNWKPSDDDDCIDVNTLTADIFETDEDGRLIISDDFLHISDELDLP